jgi:hypothetical protein
MQQLGGELAQSGLSPALASQPMAAKAALTPQPSPFQAGADWLSRNVGAVNEGGAPAPFMSGKWFKDLGGNMMKNATGTNPFGSNSLAPGDVLSRYMKQNREGYKPPPPLPFRDFTQDPFTFSERVQLRPTLRY